MKKIFYDFECFKFDWLVVFIDYDTKEKTVVINNRDELQAFYDLHKDDIFCGYNSRTYDQIMFKGILQGKNAFDVNNQIILEGKKEYQILDRKNKIPFNNYDCILLNKSLKQLEGFLNSKIKESDIPFTIQRPLTQAEIDETVMYCTHDVEQTIVVFNNTTEEFDAQMGLIESFDLPMSSFGKTKAQLVAEILQANRCEGRGDEFDIVIPDTLILGEKYQYIADWYLDKKNHNYARKLNVDVAGVPHVFGYGGIHGAVQNYVKEGIILCCDVASLYPSIIIEYGYMSRGVDGVEKYREIRETRLELKKKKDKRQLPLKIVLNSAYGTFKDKFNPLYDPRQSNNVCVTGQLLLLDLIEKIEPYCELAQSNTDGVFLLVKDQETATKIKEIAKEWEIRTRLTLEWDEYVKLVQKDVNNYIIVDKDGGYKSKGAYLKKLSPIDADLLIVNKALIDYFTKGISIRDTIMTAKNLGDFQKIVKVSSLYEYALVNGQKIKEKVLRVFASKDKTATGVFKVKLVDGEERIEKIANTPEKCFVNNEDLNDAGIPDNLDLEYYVSMAESRLDDFYNGEKKSKAKPKSEIKGVNEIVYNAIIDLDLAKFDNFIELLQYVNDNSIANIRQMEILTKLNYFEKYGGNKKLFSVMTEFYKGKNCYVKTNSDQLKLEKLSKLKDFEYYETDSEFSTKENVEFRLKYLGYFITHNECDRAKLVVDDVFPLKRKSDGKQFGYSVVGISIGSGKETRYTVFNRDFSRCGEIEKGDIVLCIGWKRDGEYFSMNEYKKIY